MAVPETLRVFACARCKSQVLICSSCDRGNIYCSPECSKARRQKTFRDASKRYQASAQGARNHAKRQRHYRERSQKVTHQGSSKQKITAKSSRLGGIKRFFASSLRARKSESTKAEVESCHFCGRTVGSFVRLGFIGSLKYI